MSDLWSYLGRAVRNTGRMIPQIMAQQQQLGMAEEEADRQRDRQDESDLMSQAYLEIAQAGEERRQQEFEQQQAQANSDAVMASLTRGGGAAGRAPGFMQPAGSAVKDPTSLEGWLARAVIEGDDELRDKIIDTKGRVARATKGPETPKESKPPLSRKEVQSRAAGAAKTLQSKRVKSTEGSIEEALLPHLGDELAGTTEAQKRASAKSLGTGTIEDNWFSKDEEVPPADTIPASLFEKLDQFRSPEYLAAAQDDDSVEIVDPLLAEMMREIQGDGGGDVEAQAEAALIGEYGREEWENAPDEVRRAAVARWIEENGRSN